MIHTRSRSRLHGAYRFAFSSCCTQRSRLNRQSRRSFYKGVAETDEQLKPKSITFFGTDEYASHVLQAIVSNTGKDKPLQHVKSIEAVCPPGRKFGRKQQVKEAAVKQTAISLGLPVHEIPYSGIKDWVIPSSAIQDHFYNIAVVVSFGYLVPSRVIDAFDAAVNLHPSLLPRHRGASPIQYAIKCDDKVTGASVIELAKGRFDVGRILGQDSIDLYGTEDYQELSARLAVLGSSLLVDVLANIEPKLKDAKPQDDTSATLAPKVTSDSTRIHWATQTVRQIDCLYRAFAHQARLHTVWNDIVIILRDLCVVDLPVSPQDVYGLVKYDTNASALAIRCQDGWVGFKTVHLPTKKPTSALQFANGYGVSRTNSHQDMYVT